MTPTGTPAPNRGGTRYRAILVFGLILAAVASVVVAMSTSDTAPNREGAERQPLSSSASTNDTVPGGRRAEHDGRADASQGQTTDGTDGTPAVSDGGSSDAGSDPVNGSDNSEPEQGATLAMTPEEVDLLFEDLVRRNRLHELREWMASHPAEYNAWEEWDAVKPRDLYAEAARERERRRFREQYGHRWWGEVGPARPTDITDLSRLEYDNLVEEFGTMMYSADGTRRTVGFLSLSGGRFYSNSARYGDLPIEQALDFEPKAIIEYIGEDSMMGIARGVCYQDIGDGYVRPGIPISHRRGVRPDEIEYVLIFEGIERLSMEILMPTRSAAEGMQQFILDADSEYWTLNKVEISSP